MLQYHFLKNSPIKQVLYLRVRKPPRRESKHAGPASLWGPLRWPVVAPREDDGDEIKETIYREKKKEQIRFFLTCGSHVIKGGMFFFE